MRSLVQSISFQTKNLVATFPGSIISQCLPHPPKYVTWSSVTISKHCSLGFIMPTLEIWKIEYNYVYLLYSILIFILTIQHMEIITRTIEIISGFSFLITWVSTHPFRCLILNKALQCNHCKWRYMWPSKCYCRPIFVYRTQKHSEMYTCTSNIDHKAHNTLMEFGEYGFIS